MTGPVLVVELPRALSQAALSRLHGLLLSSSTCCEDHGGATFDVSVPGGALGIRSGEGPRPFLVGVGDSVLGTADDGEMHVAGLIGFVPTHSITVSAMFNDAVDHTATALLTAAVLDAVGEGVAWAELRYGQESSVAGLEGVIATEPAIAYGSATFLRAWAAQPAFRLVK
ncbi:DUF6368 family protein [Streptomyces sp. NPDC053513]|uniref:DUF6368 family protein n=1 Tax=unclassified Streptomyces TaxID=2593676 RepID=UPI0037D56F98